MARDRRDKASDVFRNSNFVFAEKVGFDKAFPEIESITVEVNESKAGMGGTTRTYTKSSLGEYIDCSNSLCYNGGFSVGSIIREMVRKRETAAEGSEVCRGYEGSPKGRRKYRDCLRFFKWKAEIEYKPESEAATGE